MQCEVPLGCAKPAECVSSQVPLAQEGACCRILGRWAKRTRADAPIGTASTDRSGSKVNRFSAWILRTIKVKWNSGSNVGPHGRLESFQTPEDQPFVHIYRGRRTRNKKAI